MTSGIRNDYFKVAGFGGMERIENRQPDIPRYGKTESAAYKYTKGGIDGFELEAVQENELTRKFKQAHDALWAGGNRNVHHEIGFLMGLNRGQSLPDENFLLVHNEQMGPPAEQIGFNLGGIKQVRVKDTHTLREQVRRQVEIFYGLAGG